MSRSTAELPLVAVTMGDASGIGPELAISILSDPDVHRDGSESLLVAECIREGGGLGTGGPAASGTHGCVGRAPLRVAAKRDASARAH